MKRLLKFKSGHNFIIDGDNKLEIQVNGVLPDEEVDITQKNKVEVENLKHRPAKLTRNK